MLVLPKNPEARGNIPYSGNRRGKYPESTDHRNSGPSGNLESLKSKTGEELPYWRIDDFTGGSAGKYKAELIMR